MENKNTGIIVLLVLVIIGLIVYLIYDKNQSKNDSNINIEEQNKQEEINNYNVNDYVLVTDYEFNKNCIDCGTYGTVKKVEFKTLPLSLTTEFNSKHTTFINPGALETAKLSNEIIYGINKNVLSIYTKESKSYDLNTDYHYYSLNIDLDSERIITNQEMLELYNINSSDMFEKILNNIANTVTTEQFLLSTIGDVTAETVSINKFKENIKSYAKQIDNRYDVVTLYLQNNKLIVVYDQAKMLSILGMGTHMGIGLNAEPQSIQLN